MLTLTVKNLIPTSSLGSTRLIGIRRIVVHCPYVTHFTVGLNREEDSVKLSFSDNESNFTPLCSLFSYKVCKTNANVDHVVHYSISHRGDKKE